MAHTPGPWIWTDGENPIDIATYESPGYYNNPELKSEVTREDIIGCDEYWIIGPFMDDEVMKANAHLIAAAPDMLEALLTVAAGAEADGWPPGWGAVQAAVSSAIAKAEGR